MELARVSRENHAPLPTNMQSFLQKNCCDVNPEHLNHLFGLYEFMHRNMTEGSSVLVSMELYCKKLGEDIGRYRTVEENYNTLRVDHAAL